MNAYRYYRSDVCSFATENIDFYRLEMELLSEVWLESIEERTGRIVLFDANDVSISGYKDTS